MNYLPDEHLDPPNGSFGCSQRHFFYLPNGSFWTFPTALFLLVQADMREMQGMYRAQYDELLTKASIGEGGVGGTASPG